MLTATNLFAEIGAPDADAIARDLHAAISHGARVVGTEPTAERRRGSAALMCASGEILVEVALVSQALQRQVMLLSDPADPLLVELLELLRDTSAAASRLLWRALEAHPRDSYQLDAGRDGVTRVAGAVLGRDAERQGLPPRPPVTIARAALGELFEALAAETTDRTMVPVRLAASLGYVVSLHMLAGTLLERGRPA